MLKVDRSLLQRGERLRFDARIRSDDPLWGGSGLDLANGLEVHLEAMSAGSDIVVRGTLGGVAAMQCRRCLMPVRVTFEEPVVMLYRPESDAGPDPDEENYTFGERAREVDLTPAIREQALLAAPEYVLCKVSCAGLCPRCGKDLNRGPCGCVVNETDERWAVLKRLRPDG